MNLTEIKYNSKKIDFGSLEDIPKENSALELKIHLDKQVYKANYNANNSEKVEIQSDKNNTTNYFDVDVNNLNIVDLIEFYRFEYLEEELEDLEISFELCILMLKSFPEDCIEVEYLKKLWERKWSL